MFIFYLVSNVIFHIRVFQIKMFCLIFFNIFKTHDNVELMKLLFKIN